jgi:hypothetical protein
MNPTQEILLCGCTDGIVFVRPCSQPAVFQCVRCGCPLCRKHCRSGQPGVSRQDPAAILCPACYADSGRDSAIDANSDDSDWRVSSSGYGWHRNPGTYPLQGEGGATVGEGEILVEDFSDEPFSSEDYEAFDAVSEYDRNAGLDDGYDS